MAAGDASGEGIVRIRFTDANRGVMTKVFEARTEDLDVSTDPRQQPLVAMSGIALGQDDLIILEIKGDSATTFDKDLSRVSIPITVLSTATGQRTPTNLVYSDFSAADTTVADTWTEVGAYTIPAQQKVRMGKEIPDNSRIYINVTTTA